jgi:flagellin-like protein
MNKKGITPVISVVLLLMITIALIAFAFVWFVKIWGVASTTTETNVGNTATQMSKAIRIDNVYVGNITTTITVSNVGSEDILSTELSTFVDGQPVNCTFSSGIVRGTSASCVASVACTTMVKVVSPSNPATEQC